MLRSLGALKIPVWDWRYEIMVNYVLLYKDEAEQISYFYNMDDESVYSDQQKADSRIFKKAAICGSIVALFMYPTIRNAEVWLVDNPKMLCIQIIVLGLLIGWLIAWLIIQHCKVYFIPENRMDMSKEEVGRLYIKGKNFRKKYNRLFMGLLAFAIVCTYILGYLAMNTYYFWCCTLLWSMEGLLFWVIRPLCLYRFKKEFRTNNVS